MNREEIIRMAREAGLHRHQHNLMSNPMQIRFSYDGYEENIERFANLVAAKERERCAKVCDDYIDHIHEMRDNDESLPDYQAELAGRQAGAGRCAEAIRSLK